eukprot:g4504.t1
MVDVGIEAGSWVWMPDDEESVLPAQVEESFKPGETAKVKTEDGEVHELDGKVTEGITPLDEQVLSDDVDNLIQLNELTENTILHNLRIRFKADKIYTFVSSILVAVNPFKMLEVYTPELLDSYKEEGTEGKAPHCWSIADNAYRNFLRDHQSQSVIVSGESGSGKTESTKLILQYLAEVSAGHGAVGRHGADDIEDEEEEEGLEQRILQANPVMEAFGNAKTVRNNNSSRFGKLISIQMSRNGAITGGSVVNYLLEKTRVVHQAEGERNYHIFYQVVAGCDSDAALKKQLEMLDASEFHYMNQSGVIEIPGMSDLKEFREMRNAMNVLSMKTETQDTIFRIVAGLLHCGNIEFEVEARATQEDGSKVADQAVIDIATRLLGVSADELTKALVSKNIGTRSVILVSYSVEQATVVRDALTKAIYSKLFDFLIRDINIALAKGSGGGPGGAAPAPGDVAADTSAKMVCVLDIFGFESFEYNSFEQLCINYCNEKLQFHFNEHIFSMEQEEYTRQGINVEHITYVDNTPCLELLEAKGTGIFAMIDEEINVPRGSDDGFLQKVMKNFASHDNVARPKPKQCKDVRECFVIIHYAGAVAYNTTGFLEKNKDSLHDDLRAVLSASSVPLVAQLMKEGDGAAPVSSPAPRRAARGGSKKATVGSQFKLQLKNLMTTLNTTSPHFIRCVKPNMEKVGNKFTSLMVMSQLRYAGLLEVCRIRQVGYPVRKEFDAFMRLYGVCAPGAKDIDAMLAKLQEDKLLEEGEWAKGKEKVFLRNKQSTKLDKARENAFSHLVLVIQRGVRRMVYLFKFRRHLKTLHEVRDATAARDLKKLEHWLNMCSELPWGGAHTEHVKAGKKMLPRLQEEQRVLAMLRSATEDRDMSELEAALAKVDCMDPPLADTVDCADEIGKARELAKKLAEEKELKNKLREATASRDAEALASLLAQADAMELADCDELNQARALKTRLEEEASTVALLEDAVASKNLSALSAAMSKMTEMGLSSHDEMAKARALQAELEQQQRARNALRDAMEAGDASQLEEALRKAAASGITAEGEGADPVLVKAVALKADLDTKAGAIKNLDEAVQALDEAKLKKAIEAAEKAGVPAAALKDANKALAQLKDEAEAVEQLKAAIKSKAEDKLSAALSRAQELALKSPAVDEAVAALKKLGAAAEGSAKLKEVAATRDAAALEKAIEEAKAVGVKESAVAEASAALERLQQEAKCAALLREAIAGGADAVDKLKAAMEQASQLGLANSEAELVKEAKAALVALDNEAKIVSMTAAAARSRTSDAVAAVLEKAAELGVGGETLEAAKALQEEVSKEEALSTKIQEAMAGKDEKAVKALVDEMDVLQRERSKSRVFNNATLREARVLLDREGMSENTKKDMASAIESKDLAALNAAIEMAIELGIEGEEVEAAKKAQSTLGASDDVASKLGAAIKAVKISASGALQSRDLEPLQSAIDKAVEAGHADDAALKDAQRLMAAYSEQILLQAQIDKAMEAQDVKAVSTALSRVRELDLDFQLVGDAYAMLDELDAEFSDDNEGYGYSDEEEGEEDEAHERFLEKLEQASNAKFEFHKYPKLRTPDDFAKGTLVNKKSVKEKFLKWQKKIIAKSLQKLDEAGSKLSTQIHKSLLGYCGERHMSFPASLARNILQAGQKAQDDSKPELSDEVYLLLLKHLTENPNPVSESCAWHVLCMAVNTFPPSASFEPYLMHFLGSFRALDGAVGNFSRYALRRLEGMLKAGSNDFLPSAEEIDMYKERPPVLASVFLVDGNPVAEDLPLTPDFDVDRVCFLCAQFVELPESRLEHFGLFQQMADEGQPGGLDASPLKGEAFVGDLWVANERGEIPKFTLVFKRKMVTPVEPTLEEDEEDEGMGRGTAERLTYLQVQSDVIDGNVPLGSASEVAAFAARGVAIEEEDGCVPDSKDALEEADFMSYVPLAWRERATEDVWADAIMAQAPLVEGVEPDDLQSQVINSVAQAPTFGMLFFHVEKDCDAPQVQHLPEDMLLGLSLHGMHLVANRPARDLLMSFMYADIQSWEVHSRYIRFNVYHEGEEAPMEFGQAMAVLDPNFKLKVKTPHSKNIIGLMRSFIDLISAGLPPSRLVCSDRHR